MAESKRWNRFLRLMGYVGASLLFLLVLLVLLVTFPNPVLRPLLLSKVNEHIPGTLEVDSLAIRWGHIKAQGISYRADETARPMIMEELKADYTLDHTLTPFFTHIRLIEPQVHAVYDKTKGLEVKGLPQMEEDKGKFKGFLDIPPILLEGGSLSFDTEFGPVQLVLNGTFSIVNQVLFAEGQAELSSTFVGVKGDMSMEGRLNDVKGTYELHEFVVPQLFAIPIAGGGTFGTTPKSLYFKGEFQNEKLGIHFKNDTRHDIDKNEMKTKVNFTIPSLNDVLKASKTDFPDLPQISGGLSGEADFLYKNEKLKGGAKVRLKNLSVEDKTFQAKNIRGTIRLKDIENFTTPAQQQISISKLEAFIPLRNVKVTFKHLGGGKVTVHRAKANLENGTVSTGSFTWSPHGELSPLTVEIMGVSAEYIGKLARVSDLRVTGRVDGKLMVEVKGDDFSLKKGSRLWVSNPPGVIEYRPSFSQDLKHKIKELTGNENPMDLALIALWNLHYNTLELKLEKQLQKELSATLHLKGKNPDVFSGHPFEFNINVSGETLRLIRETLKSIE